MSTTAPASLTPEEQRAFMEVALESARLSPPMPNKFCVGAALIDADEKKVLSTGYSLELPDDNPADPGKTHAEQCCFIKIAKQHKLPEERIGEVLPKNTVLFTTMEPCNERLSGNRPCVERILRLKDAIKVVYVGIAEPSTFIAENNGPKKLEEAGVRYELVEGLYDRIAEVTFAGHDKK